MLPPRPTMFWPFILLFVGTSNCQLAQTIQTALNLGNSSLNYTREDCIWRANNDVNSCPDPEVRFFLYTKPGKKREEVDLKQSDWLRQSSFDHNRDSVLLVHGYAGGDNTFPMSMLRDAYIKNGSYNVFIVDWGGLAKLPCYPAAVHNMRTAARCSSRLLNILRDAAPGELTRTTCVGHSLGAHVCGLMSDYIFFRIDRIIGLDPARPLVRNPFRLRQGSALQVQIIHTNAGNYGETTRLGTLNFCLNGGRSQHFCDKSDNLELCSHVMAVCYMAASLNKDTAVKAHPCARRCPNGPRPTHRLGLPVLLGENAPMGAMGYYCSSTKLPPYCPKSPDDAGHPWCCVDGNSQTLQIPAPEESVGVGGDSNKQNETIRSY